MKLNSGQVLGRTLKQAGVEKVFGVVGHGNIGLIDGLVQSGIDYISCHHETVAGMAADEQPHGCINSHKEVKPWLVQN